MNRSEQAIAELRLFWHRFRRERETSFQQRLDALRDYAKNIVVPRKLSPEAKRRHFQQCVDWRPEGSCFLCRQQSAAVRHHVIPVSKGGTNRSLNLVGLCHYCHALIHPWLRKRVPAVPVVFDPTPRLVRATTERV
jgi:5-methylcytosine-specific restriction endonuclease McrA